jgi:photosystem II stability/assembly factor-like uncharacterized protein
VGRTPLRKIVAVLFVLLAFSQRGQAQMWKTIGPSPLVPFPVENDNFAGRIAGLAVDPVDPKHWFAGVSVGGVWETHDSGLNWLPRTEGQPTTSVGAIAFAPSNSSIIYVGTGEANLFFNGAQAGGGILKSTDAGATWTMLSALTFARTSVSSVHVHPLNPDIVIVSNVRGGQGRDWPTTMPSPPPLGVFISTDGGSNWNRTLTGQVTAVEIDAGSFNRQYAAIGGDLQTPGVAGVAEGLYRSTDGGQSWANIPGPWGTSTGRIALAFAPSNSNVLYASVEAPGPNVYRTNGSLLGLFRSDNAWDAAPTWIRVPTDVTSPPGTTTGGYCGRTCSYNSVISVDPSNPNTLYVGASTLWRCNSCSASPSWTAFPGGDTHVLVWIGSRLIVGDDHGLLDWLVQASGGLTGNRANGMPTGGFNTIQFLSGALHPTDPNVIVGSTQDNQAVKWTGNGTAWSRLSHTNCEGEISLSSKRPDTDWMCVVGNTINRTTDGGTLVPANGGIIGGAPLQPVRKCPSDDNVFVTGTNQPWRTNNFFSSTAPAWAPNGPPNPGAATLNGPAGILSIDFATTDVACNTYAFGTRGGQVRMTMDGGNTWRDLDPGQTLPARPVNWLAFDPGNSNVLYAAFSSFSFATSDKPGHLYKTTNATSGSATWTNISLPDDQPYNVVAIDPRNTNQVYVGTDAGIWYSADGGAGWQRFGPDSGLPNVPIYDLKINPTTDRIVAFTYGRGAFVFDRNATPPSAAPPAIPSTTSTRAAVTGVEYSRTLATSAGKPPYTWSLGAGSLPPGMTLSDSGTISGTPTASGVFTYTLFVKDSSGGLATRTYTLTVIAPVEVVRTGFWQRLFAGWRRPAPTRR